MNRASKRFGGKVSFFLGVLRTLVRLRNPLLQVTVDGKQVYEGPTLLVAVANGKYFGGSMMIAPMADLQDGEFDVVVVSAMTRLRVLKKIGKIYRGEHLAEPEVHVYRGSRGAHQLPQARRCSWRWTGSSRGAWPRTSASPGTPFPSWPEAQPSPRILIMYTSM